ncbi:Cytokine-dependent hematopoietic cell linker [Nibea albiflora]|uniref:Cytokine-dependent hematopoietic cell linker n=1 Tax=Nibea albiflora TaxID=240163 RepID=A0ACB7EQG3_NIBAL|nr:Cytokine-dependent hematopoietic cell linker [Nibea albiflora]
MSFSDDLSKVEVMGWSPQSLADYMRRLKLTNCDKVVMKGNISGAQFLESGSDYEGPQQEDGEDSYICAMNESQTAGQQDSEDFSEEECEQPPLPLRPRLPPKVPQLHDKREGSTVMAPGSSTSKTLQPRPPKATDVPKRNSKLLPPPPVPTPQPAMVTSPTPGPRGDGVFLVRDSSHGSDEHPYTLMLLKQGKIYNIKIRYQGNFYSLGTGHYHNKSFPGVKEMITHHTHTPLVLIDAMDQSSEAHSHCCLLHPVGL